MGEELYKVKARRNIQKGLTALCVEQECVRQRKRQKHFKWTATPTRDVRGGEDGVVLEAATVRFVITAYSIRG